MKIESSESSIKLIPETDWEYEQLSRMTSKGIEKVRWTDDYGNEHGRGWKGLGPLIIEFKTHPWNR